MATIQGVYVALFGRPADPTGLAYFNSVTKNGADLSAIGNLAGQKEYTDRFTGMNNAQIINTIYQSLFGRDAEAAGLEFFATQMNIGKLTINNIAIAILDGAQGDDKKISANKIAAADLYTKGLDTATEVASYMGNDAAALARAFIKGITTAAATQADADASIKLMVGKGAAGVSVALTTGDDTFNATTGITVDGKAVLATDRDDTITASLAAGKETWDPAKDTIDAGFGRDTFVLKAATGSVAVAKDKLKSVEVLNVTTAANGSILDVTEAKELVEIVSDASVGALEVKGINLKATVGLKGAIVTSKATTFTFDKADGSSDTATLTLNGATADTTVTIAAVETVNVANADTSTVDALTVAAAKAINVAGSGELTLGVAGNKVTETLSAADFNGKFTIDAASLSALKTIAGGKGTDKITVSALHSNDLTVNGGAGSDTLTVTAVNNTTQKSAYDAAKKVVADKVTDDATYKASDAEAKAIADAKAALDAVSVTKALTLTGGADADIFVIGKTGNVNTIDTNDNFVKSLIIISDFDKSADAIKFAYGKDSRDVLLGAEQAEITAAKDLLAATKVAALYTEKAGTFSTFTYGGDTYLFGQDVTDKELNAGDTLVKITGLASVSDLNTTNFQFA